MENLMCLAGKARIGCVCIPLLGRGNFNMDSLAFTLGLYWRSIMFNACLSEYLNFQKIRKCIIYYLTFFYC